MDGYAVRAEDVASLPARLSLIGGRGGRQRLSGRVASGEAVRIFTGAPVPDGADTVVIQENTEEADGVVIVIEQAEPGRHIRPRGQDFREGEVLLEAGTRLGAPRAASRRRHEPCRASGAPQAQGRDPRDRR